MKSGKVFKDTKYKFIEEMYKWSDAERNSGGAPKAVLDVVQILKIQTIKSNLHGELMQ
jgi:hypothetical protein